jgi:hypothetical protein
VSRTCTICADPRIREITGAVMARRPLRWIAEQISSAEYTSQAQIPLHRLWCELEAATAIAKWAQTSDKLLALSRYQGGSPHASPASTAH